MSQVKELPAESSVQPKWLTITGWVLTGLITAAMLASAAFKCTVPLKIGGYAEMQKQMEAQGFSVQVMTIIAIVEFCCALLYVFPRTAILGAVLLEGYLGGAIVVHVIEKQSVLAPLIIGVMMWLGIYLREPRLRAIMPLR